MAYPGHGGADPSLGVGVLVESPWVDGAEDDPGVGHPQGKVEACLAVSCQGVGGADQPGDALGQTLLEACLPSECCMVLWAESL